MEFKEPNYYTNIHISGSKKRVEEQEPENLEDKRTGDKKRQVL